MSYTHIHEQSQHTHEYVSRMGIHIKYMCTYNKILFVLGYVRSLSCIMSNQYVSEINFVEKKKIIKQQHRSHVKKKKLLLWDTHNYKYKIL